MSTTTHVAPEGLTGDHGTQKTTQSLAPKQRNLHLTTILHGPDEAHDGIMREVGVPDGVTGVVEHRATGKVHDLQVRLKHGKFIGVHCGEKPIRPMIPAQNLCQNEAMSLLWVYDLNAGE